MAKRFWRIGVQKGYETLFDKIIPAGSITDAQLRELLKCLAAKTMSYEDIVGGYVKRKTKLAHKFLDVQGDGLGYYCGIVGSDPTSIASLLDENKKPIPRPKFP
jgi:hypothetical protein